MLNAIARPFGVLLLWLYEWTGNYGVAVLLFAIVVKLLLMPFMLKSKKSSMKTARLQPQIKELQKKHAANKQKLNEEMQKLYREEGVKPLGGCLWTIIPFPILIALYQAIRFPITIMMGLPEGLLGQGGAVAAKLAELGFSATSNAAYGQIEQARFISEHFSQFAGISDKLRQIDFSFLGMNLGDTPSYKFLWTTDWSEPNIWLPALGLFLIPIISGLLTYFSTKISMKLTNQTSPDQAQTMKSMNMMMPLVTVWFSFIMPSALGLYWIGGMLFSMVQDAITNNVYGKKLEVETAEFMERQKRRDTEIEEKRKETERLKAENETEKNPNTSKEKIREKDKKDKAERAADWERKRAADRGEYVKGSSGVGDRPFARGRAFTEDRFAGGNAQIEAPVNPDEVPLAEEKADSDRRPKNAFEEEGVHGLSELSDGGEEEDAEDFYGEGETEDDEDK